MRQVLDCALIVNLGSNSHPKSAYFLSLRIINRFFWKHLCHLCRLCKLDSKWHQVARLALSTSVVIMLFSLPLEKLNMESCRKRITCPMDPMDRMDPMWCPRVKIAARLTKNGCDPENRWVQRLQDDVWTLGRWRAYLSFDKFCWWVYSSTFSGVMFFRAIWCALMWSCTWIVYWIWGMPKWPMWKASCGSSWPSNPCEIGWNYWLNYMKLDVKQNEYPIFNIHLFAIFRHYQMIFFGAPYMIPWLSTISGSSPSKPQGRANPKTTALQTDGCCGIHESLMELQLQHWKFHSDDHTLIPLT